MNSAKIEGRATSHYRGQAASRRTVQSDFDYRKFKETSPFLIFQIGSGDHTAPFFMSNDPSFHRVIEARAGKR